MEAPIGDGVAPSIDGPGVELHEAEERAAMAGWEGYVLAIEPQRLGPWKPRPEPPPRRVGGRKVLKQKRNGGADGTRTRNFWRDRPVL